MTTKPITTMTITCQNSKALCCRHVKTSDGWCDIYRTDNEQLMKGRAYVHAYVKHMFLHIKHKKNICMTVYHYMYKHMYIHMSTYVRNICTPKYVSLQPDM